MFVFHMLFVLHTVSICFIVNIHTSNLCHPSFSYFPYILQQKDEKDSSVATVETANGNMNYGYTPDYTNDYMVKDPQDATQL